jgi:DNA-directed RNA polymerase specialized sigma24 family protein
VRGNSSADDIVDYEGIKAAAKELGRPMSTLIAQAPNTDPFYAGVPFRLEKAEWFAELWNRFGFGRGVHIRRIHYQLVSQARGAVRTWAGKSYENTAECYAGLGDGSRDARHLDLVPIDAFVDRRNPAAIEYLVQPESASVETAIDDILGMPEPPRLTLRPPSGQQPYHVELWAEKSTMNDILIPLAQEYGLNLVTGLGELSVTACRNAIVRARAGERPVRILYISDFDPSGLAMPISVARKIEYGLRRYSHGDDPIFGLDVQVRPILLTHEQCVHYSLPRTPLKEGEGRAAEWEARYGEGATELDALEARHPGVFRRIIVEEVTRYYDTGLDDRIQEAADEFQADLDDINTQVVERHRDELDALTVQYDELRDKIQKLHDTIEEELLDEAPDPDEVDWPEANEGNEDPDPLFDSTRDYVEQMDRYKEHQERPTERQEISEETRRRMSEAHSRRWAAQEQRREAAVKLIEGGMSLRQAAKVLGVDHKTISRDLGRGRYAMQRRHE